VVESHKSRLLTGTEYRSGVLTTSQCITQCQRLGFTYAATEYGDEVSGAAAVLESLAYISVIAGMNSKATVDQSCLIRNVSHHAQATSRKSAARPGDYPCTRTMDAMSVILRPTPPHLPPLPLHLPLLRLPLLLLSQPQQTKPRNGLDSAVPSTLSTES